LGRSLILSRIFGTKVDRVLEIKLAFGSISQQKFSGSQNLQLMVFNILKKKRNPGPGFSKKFEELTILGRFLDHVLLFLGTMVRGQTQFYDSLKPWIHGRNQFFEFGEP
jgi:hypothetical protein